VKWRIRLVKRKNPLLGYSSINCTSAPLCAVSRPDSGLSSLYNFSLGWKCPVWVVIHSPALCRLMWLPECAAIRRLSLPPSSSLCYVGGFAPIFLSYTHTHTHTHTPLVVLECVLVGQRLHNTELWCLVTFLFIMTIRKPPLLPKWPKKPGDGVFRFLGSL